MSDAAPAPSGSSILTSGIPPSAPQAAGNGGTPPAGNSPGSEIAAAMIAAERPEWLPEKYWDAEKKTARYEDLGKGYIGLEKLLGSEKVPKPQSDEDAEGWERWYAASGRPNKVDEYEFNRPDTLPNGLGYDEDLEKDFKATAYSAGLNKKQANALYEKYVKHQLDRYTAYETGKKQAIAQAQADLQRELGGKYESSMRDAKIAVEKYADPEFKKFLDETGLGNHPAMIRAFMKIGAEVNGDTRIVGKSEPQLNQADMQRTISEFNRKNEKALFDKQHPDHARLVKERSRLYEAAFGDQA